MPVTPPDNSGSRDYARRAQARERRVQEAEKEARKRVERAYENARATELQYQKHLEQIEDEYSAMSEEERARQEAALLDAQTNGYEAIRDLQRKQQAELRRVRKQGEDDVDGLRDHYLHETYKTERKGEQKLEEMQRQQHELAHQTKLQGEIAFQQQKEKIGSQIEQVRSNHENTMRSLVNTSNFEQQRIREQTHAEELEAKRHFDERFENLMKTQNQALHKIDSRTSRKINSLKESYSRMLDAYGSRLQDPFYQMVRIDADLWESSDRFILTASIPQHEQGRLSVSIRGDELVLTGSRRSQERLEEEPGRVSTTSSYQTYTETFPLPYPVEGRQLTRRFDGDMLIVEVPKKSANAAPEVYKRPSERIRADRPQFPKDLLKLPQLAKSEESEPGEES